MFDVKTYGQAHPDLLANFNADPGYASLYGSLENYLLADAAANGSPEEKADIQGGQIVVPDGFAIQGPGSRDPAALNQGAQPLEQALLGRALPGLVNDMDQDANRRSLADQLAKQAIASTTAAGTQLGRTQGGHFDGQTYLNQNPDVAQEYQRQVAAGQTTLTADQFAEKHFLENGQREGRQPAYVQSAQLGQDFGNADRTTAANVGAANDAFKTNLGALNQAVTALQGNLSGQLGERAAALSQQIATLNGNLDTLDATQRKAITDQIAGLQTNLEQAVATQRQALTDQLSALGTTATAEAQSRRTALQQEIAGLTAAQAPLAAARNQAAQLQATAVNVGLQSTKDQLTADAAKAGYIGGSTAQDAALARATIGARGQAAQAVSAANLANAGDTRDIAVRGATGERTIADALTSANRDIGVLGANDNRTLTGSLATGRQTIANQGVNSNAGLTNQTATTRAAIGAQGANTTFADQVFGADQKRSLSDALAQGQLGLTTNLSQQTLAATQQGNAAKANYYDQDYSRSLAAALAASQLPANLFSSLTAGDTYANSGTNRALGTLNWWSTTPTAAPTAGGNAVTTNTTGNSISQLGAGLLGAAVNVGAANKWWTSPTTGTGTGTTGTGNTQNGGINPATGQPWG